MKLNVFIIGLVFFIVSCKKESTAINYSAGTLLGKWNIISDSSFTGVGLGNRGVNYHGVTGDYFDFCNDSVIYVKEGLVSDTLSYHQVAVDKLIISSFGIIVNGVADTCMLTGNSKNSLTITAPVFFTPGGNFGRIVRLSK